MKDVDFLKDIIVEAVINDKQYQMEDGRLLDYGSKKHMQELDRMIRELDFLRKQLKAKKVRKERYTISRAIDSIRHIKRAARRSGIKKGLLSEDD